MASSSKTPVKCSTSTPKQYHQQFPAWHDESIEAETIGQALQAEKQEIRKLCEEHLQTGDCDTAAFWAEKLLAVSGGRTLNERLPSIAHYLSILTAAQSWQTIITLVERHDLFTKHLVFAFFYINALYHRNLFSEIIALPFGYLYSWDDVPFNQPDSATYICAESDIIRDPQIKLQLDAFVQEKKYEARLLFLLAKTYLMMQNRPAAAVCLKHCLELNLFCSEAIYLAVDSRLISAYELRAIIGNQHSQQKSGNSFAFAVIAYLLELYDLNSDSSQPSCSSPLSQLLASDTSIQSATAYRLYTQGCVQDAYRITSTIMHEFGYYSKCFLVHVGCLVNLGEISALYQLGHQMVKLQPERESTWYTIGCYYYATGQYTIAKKFLHKCTLMNSGFGEGWLAYGHSLFYMEEHEQAMNCYLRSSRILEGHFEPLLYIAVEYCFANNFKLASDFLNDAAQTAGANALVLHEQATAAFMEQNFEKAKHILMEALRLLTKHNGKTTECLPLEHLLAVQVSNFWEPLYNNLGHVLRKLGQYAEAIQVHRKSLTLGGTKADAWFCLGVCYASQAGTEYAAGNNEEATVLTDKAMDSLNHALALRPGDDLIKTALDKVMEFVTEVADTMFTQKLGVIQDFDALLEPM